jgi:mannosyltransferase OCH1-like enzyme
VRVALFLALRYGNPGAPAWLTALQLAEAWHVPPWEIMDAEGSLIWSARWAAYQKELKKSRDMDK